MQGEQDLEAMRVGQQVEALCPPGGVDVGERRRGVSHRVVAGLRHPSNLIPRGREAEVIATGRAQSRKPCSRAAEPHTCAVIASAALSPSPARIAITMASCCSSECAMFLA